jgi:hypothetical protein
VTNRIGAGGDCSCASIGGKDGKEEEEEKAEEGAEEEEDEEDEKEEEEEDEDEDEAAISKGGGGGIGQEAEDADMDGRAKDPLKKAAAGDTQEGTRPPTVVVCLCNST